MAIKSLSQVHNRDMFNLNPFVVVVQPCMNLS